jgi:hypothetical protein
MGKKTSVLGMAGRAAMMTPAVAFGAPLLNGISQGADIQDMLPEGLVDNVKEAVSGVMNSPAVGQMQDKLGDMISGLRGGLLGRTGDLGGISSSFGEASATLFPQGLQLPNAQGFGDHFSKIKDTAKGMMG